jgi:HlyD family secretion protein
LQQIKSQKQRLDELNQDAKDGRLTATTSGRRDRLMADIERMEALLHENSTIVSPSDGRIVELRAVVGEHVTAGRPIFALEHNAGNQPLEALLYFDSQLGKSLKPGMRIELVPSVTRKERDGVLIGRVRFVESFPSTRAGMMGALRNEQLVDSFIQSANGAPIAVRAEIIADPSTPSHFKWSSGQGPDVILTSGTRCEGAVITRTHRPIALVFPALDNGR